MRSGVIGRFNKSPFDPAPSYIRGRLPPAATFAFDYRARRSNGNSSKSDKSPSRVKTRRYPPARRRVQPPRDSLTLLLRSKMLSPSLLGIFRSFDVSPPPPLTLPFSLSPVTDADIHIP